MQTQEPSQNDITVETERKSLPDKCCGIYGLRNKQTNKWYVGLSTNIGQRWKTYSRLACKKQPKLFEALSLCGFGGFEAVVLEVCPIEVLKSREVYWMREKNSVNDGYNVSESGTPVTKQMIEKISKSLSGRTYSMKHRRNMSLAHTGVPRTEAAKKSIAAARVGVSTITEDGRRRIREANARRKLIPVSASLL